MRTAELYVSHKWRRNTKTRKASTVAVAFICIPAGRFLEKDGLPFISILHFPYSLAYFIIIFK